MATADGPRDDMAAMIREMQRRIDALERKSSLANTGLTALGPGSVQVDGAIQSANFSHLVAGWKFDGTSLEANTGLIGNGALANPVTTGRIRATGGNYGFGTGAWTIGATTSVTVPAGFTQLLAICNGYTYTRNTNTTGGSDGLGGDLAYSYLDIGGLSSDPVGWPLPGNGFTGTFSGDTFSLTDLPAGMVLTLNIRSSSGFQSIPANTSTRCAVTAGLFWYR